MPYNTTAIPPRTEATGQCQLPLTKVKKIVNFDPDNVTCSKPAAFLITLATEMFIQHLAAEAHNMAKLDRKPRRNIQYKDLANAVQHHENLEFLQDVVPKTQPYKLIKDQAAETQARLRGERPDETEELDGQSATIASLPNGKRQKPLAANGTGKGGHRQSAGAASSSPAAPNGHRASGHHHRASIVSEDDPSAQLELEMRQAGRKAGGGGGGGYADDDVEMTG